MSLLKKSHDDAGDDAVKRGRGHKHKEVTVMEDAYDESDRTLDHTDAHRDVSYNIPSWFSQMVTCYMTQLKRFTKERTVWTVLVLLMLIPIVYVAMSSFVDIPTSHVTNIFLTIPLFALPILSMFLSSNICGSMLPREFNERTVYLSLPLPMSRLAFYMGKFLAGFTLTLGAVVAAYGISILLALFVAGTDVTYSSALFKSLAITVCSLFFFCSFVYMLSASSKRGAVMKGLLLLVVAIPVICVLIYMLPTIEQMKPYADTLGTIGDALKYMPVFGPDLALNTLGSSPIGSFFMMEHMSFYSFTLNFSGMRLDISPVLMCVVAIILGVLCLVRGYRKIGRRDM